jgi:hypothetical protein
MIRVAAMSALAFAMALPPFATDALPFPIESHCVVVVVGQEESGELITTVPVCLGLEANSSFQALAAFTLGRHYDGFNGTGSSISVVGSSCTGGWWNTPTAWDNRISSSYHGCAALRHYDLPSTGGSFQLTTGVGTVKNLGAMNNRTESVSYSAS